MREVGFNRASLGVQDFDPEVQEAVHRIQPREMTEQVLDWVREAGFTSVNFDLIYGLPHQTVESFNRTLDEVLQLEPDRLAVFSYAHVPWVKPAQKILEQKILPSPEVKLQLLKTVIETPHGRQSLRLHRHGPFCAAERRTGGGAKRTRQLQRNFQGYSTRGGADIYAFGMSSISQIPDAYWQNEKDLPDYYAALDAGKTPSARGYCRDRRRQDPPRNHHARHVRSVARLRDMSQRLGMNFATHFERELESLAAFEADGLVRRSATGLEVTDTGRLFIRNIAMCFDNTLAPAGERKHSKTIMNSVAIIGGGITGLTAAFT